MATPEESQVTVIHESYRDPSNKLSYIRIKRAVNVQNVHKNAILNRNSTILYLHFMGLGFSGRLSSLELI